MAVVLLIFGLIMFVGLVVVHEWGHFTAARRNGVEVEEFGIGFPPKVWLKRIKSPKGDYDFTVNALPLGGFVRLKGEHDSARTPGSFGAASLGTKTKIMLAGVALNLATALVLFTILAITGMPQLLRGQFNVMSDSRVSRPEMVVDADTPAAKGGLQTGDKLVSARADGQTYTFEAPGDLPDFTKQNAGKTIALTYEHSGQQYTTDVTLRTQAEHDADESKGYLGLGQTGYTIRRATWSAPIVSVGLAKQLTETTIKELGKAVLHLSHGETAEATKNVSGPVGIFVVLRDVSTLGVTFVLFIIAIISLTLAIMNVLPIPALDGGRLFVTLFFHAARRPLTKRTEELIHGTGFAALMVLFVLITIVDIRRFF